MKECEFCEEKFQTISLLANHVRWRHKRKQSQRKCLSCDLTFEAANFRAHLEKCTKPLNVCSACGAETRNALFCSRTCAAVKNNIDGKIGYTIYRAKRCIKASKTYRDVCFSVWEAKCAICSWEISVDVHHIDNDHTNNDVRNLIPLCSNHHIMTRMTEYRDEYQIKLMSMVAEKLGTL